MITEKKFLPLNISNDWCHPTKQHYLLLFSCCHEWLLLTFILTSQPLSQFHKVFCLFTGWKLSRISWLQNKTSAHSDLCRKCFISCKLLDKKLSRLEDLKLALIRATFAQTLLSQVCWPLGSSSSTELDRAEFGSTFVFVFLTEPRLSSFKSQCKICHLM